MTLQNTTTNLPLTTHQPPPTTWHWTYHNFRAMNTDVYSKLYSSVANSTEILEDVEALFSSIENRLSRFNPNSELSQFNYSNGSFKASSTLIQALNSAIWAAEATGGLFDPTILPNLEQAGYNRSFETIPSQSAPNGTLPKMRAGRFREISINHTRSTIYKTPTLKLDLGGIGKGWTVDRAADRLITLGPFLINAGGDLYAYGTPPNQTGWIITIPHPQDDNTILSNLCITHNAVATSSITRRRWQQGKKIRHHLIDPRTGKPANTDLLSVTVIGQRVALAEVFAKVALIIGSKHGLDYLKSIPNVEGLLVTNGDEVLKTSGFNQFCS